MTAQRGGPGERDLPGAPAPGGLPRRAGPADAEEVARLRVAMFTAMGLTDGTDAALRNRLVTACAQWLDPAAAGAADRVAVVVDAPGGGGELAASGVGSLDQRLLGLDPRGDNRRGYIASMSTDVRYRRRGYGAAVLQELLRWFDAAGVRRVDLHASEHGAPLYLAHGFRDATAREMWRPHGGSD